MTLQPLQHRMPPHGGNGPAESRRSDQSGSSIAGGTDQLASPFGKAGCFGTMSEKKRGVVSFFTGGVGRCFNSEPRAISVEMISLCCTYRMLDLLLSIDMAHFSGRGGGRHGGSRSTWKCVCVCSSYLSAALLGGRPEGRGVAVDSVFTRPRSKGSRTNDTLPETHPRCRIMLSNCRCVVSNAANCVALLDNQRIKCSDKNKIKVHTVSGFGVRGNSETQWIQGGLLGQGR